MADMLGAKLITIINSGNRLKRYALCLLQTLLTIVKERPKIVFAQNPSIVLNYFLLLAKLFFRYRIVSDAHFAGVIAFNGNKFMQKALNICNRLMDLVIVTNKEHEKYIDEIGGKALVCEDPLPDLRRFRVDEIDSEKTVLYICSYDIDEPYDIAFKASEILLKDNFKFLASGNYSKAGINPDDYPNVTFLGFLPEIDFYTRLFQSNVILDLTEAENCLVCGAYEAMAAEKPLVTSDKLSLREYFNKGSVFTKHDEISVANAVMTAYVNRQKLKEEIKEWKKNIFYHQNQRIMAINSELGFGNIKD
jgi:glycosyltransferase involved in cell wall biosynthesis